MSRILDFKSSSVAMQSTSFCSCRFSLCQTFSIMFRSGDCATKLMSILFFNRYSMTERALWSGALLSLKIQLFSGKCWAITGHKLSSSMSIYFLAVPVLIKFSSNLSQRCGSITWLGAMTVHLYQAVDSGVHFLASFLNCCLKSVSDTINSNLFTLNNW